MKKKNHAESAIISSLVMTEEHPGAVTITSKKYSVGEIEQVLLARLNAYDSHYEGIQLSLVIASKSIRVVHNSKSTNLGESLYDLLKREIIPEVQVENILAK